MKILLATDGSEHSKAAIQELINRNLSPDTKVHIVSAFESPVLIMSAPLSTRNMAPTYLDAKVMARKPAETAVENAAKLLLEENPNLSISKIVIEGSPKHSILKEADIFRADLIVVGSHGLSIIDRFLLGSVSQSIAYMRNAR